MEELKTKKKPEVNHTGDSRNHTNHWRGNQYFKTGFNLKFIKVNFL